MLESLGAFLRLTRMRRNLTQERLAELAGVSRSQLLQMEKGENISVEFLLKVAAVLELTEVPVDFLTLRDANPDTHALLVAAEAIELARSTVARVRDASHDLDRAAQSIDALLTRPSVPASSQRRIKAAAERLTATSPQDAETIGRALRDTAESSGRVRVARPKDAVRPGARRRAR